MDSDEPPMLEGPPANEPAGALGHAHVHLGDQTPLEAEPSPAQTQMDISEVELIPDSPIKNCYCHMLEWPDRQPESESDWDVCDHCKAARHPVDDVSTDVDTVELGGTMVEPPQGVDEVMVDTTPPRSFRRLRPMRMVDDLFMGDNPGQRAISDAHDQPDEPHVSTVSWFKKKITMRTLNLMNNTMNRVGTWRIIPLNNWLVTG